jgi:hypothetical protein
MTDDPAPGGAASPHSFDLDARARVLWDGD